MLHVSEKKTYNIRDIGRFHSVQIWVVQISLCKVKPVKMKCTILKLHSLKRVFETASSYC